MGWSIKYTDYHTQKKIMLWMTPEHHPNKKITVTVWDNYFNSLLLLVFDHYYDDVKIQTIQTGHDTSEIGSHTIQFQDSFFYGETFKSFVSA